MVSEIGCQKYTSIEHKYTHTERENPFFGLYLLSQMCRELFIQNSISICFDYICLNFVTFDPFKREKKHNMQHPERHTYSSTS